MAKTIVIYHDEGVGEFGLSCLKQFFAGHTIRFSDASAIIDNSALIDADFFIMPGGADLPYCRKLNSRGCQNIRTFVDNGGIYLGICAGAYFASNAIEFHKGRDDEICQPRELCLINTVAIGSLPEFAPYYDATINTTAVIPITLKDNRVAKALYYGGCTFIDIQDDVEIIARYPDNRPAIIRKGNIILSGIHFEMNADLLKNYPTESDAERAKLQQLVASLADTNINWNEILF
jgi:glutamine amidotransferase-like uncharacterized protein